jgi:hypothetical protein
MVGYMDTVSTHGLMDVSTKVNIRTINIMESVNTFGLMANSIMENGLTINSMASEFLPTQRTSKLLTSGNSVPKRNYYHLRA